MEFNHELEMKLRNALKAKNEDSFYFITKPETSKEIWNITATALTAIEYKYPEKRQEIFTFLDKYSEPLTFETKPEYELDNQLIKEFSEELDSILKDVK
ncbi:hypothetical protein [Staphylococcus hominis]|jgi:hypothetical protein